MKTLKLLTATMLMLVAMAAGAETISHVTIGNLVYSLDTDTKVATVTDYSNEPTDVVIPNTIEYGGDYSVTTIGERAFAYCTSLASIDIPNSVTTIGELAFASCTSLASISVASDNPNYIGIDGVLFNKDKTMIVVYPEGKDGSEYTIPNSVTTIGEWAFVRCSSLASIDIPNSVTTIGKYAFAYCTSLASIDIPNSVTTIGECTFYRCTSLASVNIPNSVTTIGKMAFSHCSSLASIDIPNSVTTIGYEAFSSCESLASIDIPNSVTTIGKFAFAYCFSLASVNIGESVTTIGVGAFIYCYYITSVTCLAKECPVCDKGLWNNIFSVFDTATLYVPKQSIDAYKTTDPWSDFVNVVALEDTGIEGKPTDNAPRVDAVYDIDGRRTDSMKRGLNIVRMSDGTTRKVMK